MYILRYRRLGSTRDTNSCKLRGNLLALRTLALGREFRLAITRLWGRLGESTVGRQGVELMAPLPRLTTSHNRRSIFEDAARQGTSPSVSSVRNQIRYALLSADSQPRRTECLPTGLTIGTPCQSISLVWNPGDLLSAFVRKSRINW